MAKPVDRAMQNFRRIRRETNAGMLRAKREGRLQEFMAEMDRDARRWLAEMEKAPGARRRASGNGHRRSKSA